MQKMSIPSSIRRRDSNPRPLENESSPITTKPKVVLARRIRRMTPTYVHLRAEFWQFISASLGLIT